jgi:hypothetical protein
MGDRDGKENNVSKNSGIKEKREKPGGKLLLILDWTRKQ